MRLVFLPALCMAADGIGSVISEGKSYLNKIDSLWRSNSLLGRMEMTENINN